MGSSSGKGESAFGVSFPTPPDINQLVQQQQDLNLQTAGQLDLLNRPNQFGLFGSTVFDTNDDGRTTVTTTPSPQVQTALNNIFNLQNRISGVANQFLSNADSIIREPLDIGDLEDIGDLVASVNLQTDIPNIFDITENAQPVEDATFNLFRRRLDPIFAERERALIQDIANRGLPVGSEASNLALDRFGRERNEAFLNAADQAVLAGRDERARLFQALLSEAGFENAAVLNQANFQNVARQQGINEAVLERNQALNTLLQLQGASGGFVPLPQTLPFTPIQFQAPDLLNASLGLFGLQGQQAAALARASAANQSSKFGGVADIIGAGIGIAPELGLFGGAPVGGGASSTVALL